MIQGRSFVEETSVTKEVDNKVFRPTRSSALRTTWTELSVSLEGEQARVRSYGEEKQPDVSVERPKRAKVWAAERERQTQFTDGEVASFRLQHDHDYLCIL